VKSLATWQKKTRETKMANLTNDLALKPVLLIFVCHDLERLL
jgi:hypothetical protein